MPIRIQSFEDALTQGQGHKRVLLGNGFSIAWRPDIFSYGSLYDRANFGEGVNCIQQVFDQLDTRDFEIVMRALKNAASIVGVYKPEQEDLVEQVSHDSERLRDILVETIANNHPDRPNAVEANQYQACRQFLSNFVDVYTLNYDLLLYWTVMQDDPDPTDPISVPMNDGFLSDPDDPDADWVTWDSSQSAKLHYLHGALHLYDAGSTVQKYTWSRAGLALVDQVRVALESNKFPLFVAEDTAANKMKKIAHSQYLHKNFRSLQTIGGTLYSYGFGFGNSDQHVLRAIARNKVTRLHVGIFGDPESPSNLDVVASIERLKADRQQFNRRYNLDVQYFDSSSVNVWG